jgi:hypothetical protein
MLEFAQHEDRRSLRLLIHLDAGDREFEYSGGAAQSVELAHERGWTIVGKD